LSVAPPIDLLRYEAGSLMAGQLAKFTAQHPYWADLRERYSTGLSRLVESLPEPRF
jgi:putative proteasome-type protease